jgi:glycosyltransferase involved in cell wall biosynthesis
MKVVHFSPIYIDGWGYQDNLLPKYFKEMGHDVCVISLKRLPNYIKHENIFKDRYFIDEVEIRRINVLCFLSSNLFFTKRLYKTLIEKNPKILFHHGISFPSLAVCVLYKVFHPKCSLFVDNHADEFNCITPRIWFLLYYKFFLMVLSNLASPFVKKYYGVSYGRCDFLESIFKINKNKIELLPIGADSIAVQGIMLSNEAIKVKYAVPIDDFIVISGGKMGKDKGTDFLIQAVEELIKMGESISLVLFGSFNDKLTEKKANDSEAVLEVGWCNRASTLELLKMADVAVWPLHHTTLIEDSIACLTPLILRKTRTTEHLIKGNGIYVNLGSVDEIKTAIIKVMKTDVTLAAKQCREMRDKIDYRAIVNSIVADSFSD